MKTPSVGWYVQYYVSINRLLNMIFTDTGVSARSIATILSAEQSHPLPDERYAALETVIYAMIKTQRHVASKVLEYKNDLCAGALANDETKKLSADFDSSVSTLKNHSCSDM